MKASSTKLEDITKASSVVWNENGPRGSYIGGTVWDRLGVVAFLEEVWPWGWDLRFVASSLSALGLYIRL